MDEEDNVTFIDDFEPVPPDVLNARSASQPPVAAPEGAGEDDEEDAEIRDTDIVFDCPHCGKSLVIDYQGAGLIITCTQCHKPVQVPIPEGMQISDLDQGPENLQAQLSTLRAALEKSERGQRELEMKVAALEEKRVSMERARAGQIHRLAEIRGACEHVQRVLNESSSILNRIFDMIQAEIRQ